MNQNYKFKSLEIAKNGQEKEQSQTGKKLSVYEVGETRTIDFVLSDGSRQSFPYAHYHTAWLGKENNERIIKIFFSTHHITIKGYCLDTLYDELLKQSVKFIKAHDERYADMVDEDKIFVNKIKIEWKIK